MNKRDNLARRNGILFLILGAVVLFSGLALLVKAENTYYVTQFAILVIWCVIYGLGLITIGVVLLNAKKKTKWLLIIVVGVLLVLLTPKQKIYDGRRVIEYKSISYTVTESLNEDGKSYHKVTKVFGKTIQDKTIEGDSLYKKFHVVEEI